MRTYPLVGFIALLLIVGGAGCGSSTTTTPTTTTPTSTTQEPGKLETRVTDNNAGYTFIHATLFTGSTGADAANDYVLKSVYSVTDNPSGIPGNEHTHPFQVEIQRRATSSLMDAMKKDNPTFATTYEAFTKKAPLPAGFMDVISVAGKEAYQFNVGAEGINMKYVYIPRTATETFVIKLSYIGDVLKTSMKPQALAEQEQLGYFTRILKTFTFTK